MSKRPLLALLCTSILAGCATGQAPRTPHVAIPATFEAAEAGASAAQLDHWWLLYGDPQLNALVAAALAGSFDSQIALARLEEARALRAATLAGLRPQGGVNANVEARQTETIQAPDLPGLPEDISLTPEGVSVAGNAGFNVSWELDLFGRRGATRRTANADFAAVRFNVEATRAAVAAEIADTLFQARALAVQLEDARATLRIQEELVRISRRRAEAGLSPASDTARIEADEAQVQAQVRDLEAQLRTLQRSLLLLTGRAGLTPAAVPVAADLGPVPPPPHLIPGELLVRRPDVREALARLESAAGNLTLAELELFPRISLTPSIGLQAQPGGLSGTTGFWAFGVGFSVPILDRPRLKAQLRASGARAEQAVLGYERAVQTAFTEADQLLTLYEADRNRIVMLRAGERRARVAYEAALKRYRVGLDSLVSVLDAERAWRAARSVEASAHAQALRRSVQLFRAFGGGWNPSATGVIS